MNPIFDKDKILERERAAALFGEMAFEAAGKLIKEFGWDPGDPRRAILHGLIGGIMAEINGGYFGDGLTTAMINKILIDQLVKNKLVDGAELRWISGLLGVALDDGEGGAIADSATRNNERLSEEEWKDYQMRVAADIQGVKVPETEEEREALWNSIKGHFYDQDAPGLIYISGGAGVNIKLLPKAIQEYVGAGGVVIYDPVTGEYYWGASGGSSYELTPVSAVISHLYLPHEINVLTDERDRREAVTELLTGFGPGSNLVVGAGLTLVRGSDGRWLVGRSTGVDVSFSYGGIILGLVNSHRDQAADMIKNPQDYMD